MNKYEEFEKLVASMKVDFDKFYEKGIASAGVRVRKYCRDLAVLCKDTRKDVSEIKHQRKAVQN